MNKRRGIDILPMPLSLCNERSPLFCFSPLPVHTTLKRPRREPVLGDDMANHDDAGKERVQKILAKAGHGSRRACEELIVEGRVTINDQTVSILGVRADPQRDVIAVDGERVRLPKPGYWVLNKPDGASFNDPEAENILDEMVSGDNGRLFTAGRLDRHSSGLIVITNDGRLANILTHPRYRVPKVYQIAVKGAAVFKSVRNIQRALYYAMNNGKFEQLKILRANSRGSLLELKVYEGLPESLRDICLKFGHAARSIQRVRIGTLELGAVKSGDTRKLRGDEITKLLQYADEAEKGRLNYEGELVNPKKFQRDNKRSGFRKKETGTRGSKTTGQKKTVARVQRSKGKPPVKGKPRSKGGQRSGPGRGSKASPRGGSSNRPRSKTPNRSKNKPQARGRPGKQR